MINTQLLLESSFYLRWFFMSENSQHTFSHVFIVSHRSFQVKKNIETLSPVCVNGYNDHYMTLECDVKKDTQNSNTNMSALESQNMFYMPAWFP